MTGASCSYRPMTDYRVFDNESDVRVRYACFDSRHYHGMHNVLPRRSAKRFGRVLNSDASNAEFIDNLLVYEHFRIGYPISGVLPRSHKTDA